MITECTEILYASAESSQKWSISTYDIKNGNSLRNYRNGGIPVSKTLNVIDDYILTAEKGKPLLHTWQLNSEDEFKDVRLILPEPANALAVSPDNFYLAAGIGTKLYVWLLSAGKLLSVSQKHFQPITNIKFSTDGSYLLTSGQDGILIAYNFFDLVNIQSTFMPQTTAGEIEPLYQKSEHGQPITDLHINSFGRKARFVTVSTDQTCRIYNLPDGKLLQTLIFSQPLTAIVADSSFFSLYIGTESGDIRYISLLQPPATSEYHEPENLSFVGHKDRITCLAVNVTGTVLASGSEDDCVFLWDTSSRQALRKIALKGPVRNVVLGHMCVSAVDGKFMSQVVLKPLERSVDLNGEFTVGVVRKEDSVDEEGEWERSLGDKSEVEKLRVINKQMYQSCLKLAEKLYGNVGSNGK